LIATQIGEEGLDIAECDEVIFYDNVPSAIRFIQRRGRTGRRGPGKATILMAAGTRDEAYYWIARKRERTMTQALKEIETSSKLSRENPKLEQFDKIRGESEIRSEITVIVDSREGASTVVRELSRLGVTIEMRSLLTADFVLSDRVAAERKTIEDFAASIVDGRLFSQARTLKDSYEKPLLIVEGDSWQPRRDVSPEAIMGALASILVDYSLPVIWTRNSAETALLLASLSRREQIKEGRQPKIRAHPKPEEPAAVQEYIVASLPNVDAVRSRRLLQRFGTIERIFTAGKDELSQVEGIGKTISERIRQVLTRQYEKEEAGV
jgi:Fanconi anemia group M protein